MTFLGSVFGRRTSRTEPELLSFLSDDADTETDSDGIDLRSVGTLAFILEAMVAFVR